MIAALNDKIFHLEKMHGHLVYSRDDVQAFWDCAVPFENWTNAQLVSLVAFKSRFAELQDYLATAMRLIAGIEDEDTRQFTYVLTYMEQLEILPDAKHWQAVRSLRNAATHDYSG